MRGDELDKTSRAGFFGMQWTQTGCARVNSRCGSLKEAALSELVAQLVEQRPFKAWVVGSIPTELTTRAANSLPQKRLLTGFLLSQTEPIRKNANR